MEEGCTVDALVGVALGHRRAERVEVKVEPRTLRSSRHTHGYDGILCCSMHEFQMGCKASCAVQRTQRLQYRSQQDCFV